MEWKETLIKKKKGEKHQIKQQEHSFSSMSNNMWGIIAEKNVAFCIMCEKHVLPKLVIYFL